MKTKIDVTTIDAYIAHQPVLFRDTLEELRSLIKSVVPEAEETISYQVACFKYLYMLVGIGTGKKYCSLYVMSPKLVKKMSGDLEDVKVSGSTLHFIPNQPLPKALIKKIVQARVKENEERANLKKKLKQQR